MLYLRNMEFVQLKSYPMINTFVAIDFETATNINPCQIGLAIVKDGEIVTSISRLIRPPKNQYYYRTIAVHHITPEQTEHEPEFPEVWADIKDFFENALIVAHNARFDMGVLKNALDMYNLPYPNIMGYVCTCDLNHRESLEQACAEYGIFLQNHHDGEDDAINCAKLYLAYVNGKKKITTNIPIHDISCGTEKNTFDLFDFAFQGHEVLNGDILKKDLTRADPSNPFYDRKVVITGIFNMDRQELALKLKNMGADIDSSVGSRINYILIGDDPGPAKLKKVDELIASGKEIRKIYQTDLDKILDGQDYEKYRMELPSKKERVSEIKVRKTTWPQMVDKFKKFINGEDVVFSERDRQSEDYNLLKLYFRQQQKLPLTKVTLLDNLRQLEESQEQEFRKDILSCFSIGEKLSKEEAYGRMQNVFSKYGLFFQAKKCVMVELGIEFEEYKVKGIHHLTITNIPQPDNINMIDNELFSDNLEVKNPLINRRVGFLGKFSNRAALVKKVKEFGASDKSKEGLSRDTQILVMGIDIKQEDMNRLLCYEHDGWNPLKINEEQLHDIFKGYYEGFETPEMPVKKVSIDMSYYNWAPPIVSVGEGDEDTGIRCSSPLVYGESNTVYGKEIFVPDSHNAIIIRQIIGNFGGYGNSAYQDDTNIVMLSDYTLELLKQGKKDIIIQTLEDQYNKSNSKVFNIQFTCEGDFIQWVKERMEKFPDESTLSLLDRYCNNCTNK